MPAVHEVCDDVLVFRRLVMRDGNFGEREACDRRCRPDEVEKHHGVKTERCVEENAEDRRSDAGGAGEGLIERVDAHEMLFGYQVGHGRHHRGAVEGLPRRARYGEQQQEGDVDRACEDGESEGEGDEADDAVGDDHDGLAAVPVGEHSAERRDEADGQICADARQRKQKRARGAFGDVPNDGEARGVACDDGHGLPGPDGPDDGEPMLRERMTRRVKRGLCFFHNAFPMGVVGSVGAGRLHLAAPAKAGRRLAKDGSLPAVMG